MIISKTNVFSLQGNLTGNERRMKAMGAYDAYNMRSKQSKNLVSRQMKQKSKSMNVWTAGAKETGR